MLASELKDRFVKLFGSVDKKKLIIFAGITGVLLILLSELLPTTPRVKNENSNIIDYSSYIESLEQKTESIISSIAGVGRCEVMITLSQTNENVFAKNIDQNNNESSNSLKSEYVFYEENNQDSPILIKQSFPKVQGVLVVCEGADNVVVKEAIITSVTALFNVPSSKVNVSKISSNR